MTGKSAFLLILFGVSLIFAALAATNFLELLTAERISCSERKYLTTNMFLFVFVMLIFFMAGILAATH